MHEDSDYQDEDLKIDVIDFNLQADRMDPYLKIVIDNECVHVYEGEVGNDKFNYTTIAKGSELGLKLIKFYTKHPLSTPPKMVMDEINEMNALFGDDIYVEEEMPNPTMTGVEAFRSYWKSLNEKEKIEYDCFKIPDVESLKDWYYLALHHHLDNIQRPIEYKELVEDEERRWKRKLIKKINLVLTDTSYPYMTEDSRYISGFHARELLNFKDWLIHPTNSNNSHDLTFFLYPLSKINERTGKAFMTPDEFERLKNYTAFYFNRFEIPKDIIPINSIQKGNGKVYVFRCFREILRYKAFQPKYPKNLQEFIKTVFTGMKNDKDETIIKSIGRGDNKHSHKLT